MLDDVEADIAERLRAGTGGIRPRGDAIGVVRHQVVRRRRRRRVTMTVAAAATTAVAVGVSSVVLALGSRDQEEAPVADETSEAAFPIDGRFPVAYFVKLAGGRGAAKTNNFRPVKGERLNSTFKWWPADGTGEYPVFAGAAVERWTDTSAATSCEALAAEVGGGAACTVNADGERLLAYDLTVAEAFLDPFHEQATFEEADPEDLVRGVTLLRDDGWSVTLTVCSCSPFGPDLDEPPVDTDTLAEAAGADEWVAEPRF